MVELRSRKERKKEFYYILAGNKSFEEILKEKGIKVGVFDLLKIGVYSKLGNQIKKLAIKEAEKFEKKGETKSKTKRVRTHSKRIKR